MGTLIVYVSMLVVAAGIVLGLYLYARSSRRKPQRRGHSHSIH